MQTSDLNIFEFISFYAQNPRKRCLASYIGFFFLMRNLNDMR